MLLDDEDSLTPTVSDSEVAVAAAQIGAENDDDTEAQAAEAQVAQAAEAQPAQVAQAAEAQPAQVAQVAQDGVANPNQDAGMFPIETLFEMGSYEGFSEKTRSISPVLPLRDDMPDTCERQAVNRNRTRSGRDSGIRTCGRCCRWY